MVDLTKHLSAPAQKRYIAQQQRINAGLAERESQDAMHKVQLARIGHNTLIVNRYTQEAQLGQAFANWRRNDAGRPVPLPCFARLVQKRK